MNSSFPERWSFVTHIIGEPKYKYGQQEEVTVRNHNRSTALRLGTVSIKIMGWGGLKPVLRVPIFIFDFNAAGVVPCGGRKTSPRTSTIVQFIFYFGPLRSAIIF